MTIEELKQKTEGMDSEPAIAILNEYIARHPDDDEALTMRGMRWWSLGKRSLAISDYLAAIRLNPRSRACQLMRAANTILNYYNKDLYNP